MPPALEPQVVPRPFATKGETAGAAVDASDAAVQIF
jgi:hypothetical protein